MKRRTKESGNALAASVRTEMALPRMSKSARIAELESDTARVAQQPRTVMPGTVDKLIPSPTSRSRGKAQISIQGEAGYRKLRIENSLTDEHGDEVKLEKGGRVAVTVTAEEKRKRSKSFEPERGTARSGDRSLGLWWVGSKSRGK
jgi:hypothetical protein